MSTVTKDDLEALTFEDDKTLADWYCELNCWRWPDGLPDPIPEGDKDAPRRGDLMAWIKQRVGARAVSRHWNKDRMTDVEHDDFWRGNFLGDAAAKQRHEKRTMDRIRAHHKAAAKEKENG